MLTVGTISELSQHYLSAIHCLLRLSKNSQSNSACVVDETHRQRMVAEGAVQEIISAMRNFNDGELQECAYRALACLAYGGKCFVFWLEQICLHVLVYECIY